VLSGELEMLLGRSDLPAEARTRIERLASEVASMQELVEALLLLRLAAPFDGRGHEAFEPVNLADIAREAVGAAAERYPARRDDLELIAPDEVLVAGQAVLLASAVRNLVDNACKFTSSGQPIRVAVEESSPARVVVDDGGGGIPASERERIFDPFFRGGQVRDETSGFGLGLPILRHVARAHGGEVLLEDSPLGGARFILRLPAWRMNR
jgi:two-component system OmpR family sensor kinase